MSRPLTVLCLVVACAAPRAQRAAPWSELRIAGGVQAANLLQLGKLVGYRDGNTLWVFSAFTRRWTSTTAGQNATIRQANDWIVVQDGRRFSAMSSFHGRFVTLQAPPGATIVNPGTQKNDSLLVVRDGGAVHVFSGFTGAWRTRQLSGNARLAVQRHVLVAVDGREAWGLGAFGGTWVRQQLAQDASRVAADGKGGVVETSVAYWGFSADRRAWARTASLGRSAVHALAGDVALWFTPTRAVAFSATRGVFAALATTSATRSFVNRQVAVLETSREFHAFSGPLAAWTRIPAQRATARTGSAVVLLREADRVHAYSALTGTTRAIAVTAAADDVTASLAAVADAAGKATVYSALTGAWTAAPAGARGGLPALARQAALFTTPTSVIALSGRTSRFFPQTTAGPARPWVDAASAIVAASEPGRLHVFDTRRESWLTIGTSLVAGPSIWRTTLLATDGSSAIGFGAMAGEVATVRSTKPAVQLKAGSESGSVLTRDSVLAFSAIPQLNAVAQFPEFRRVLTRGNALRLRLATAPGATSVLALSAARAPVRLPGLGLLWLDPAGLIVGPPAKTGSSGLLPIDLAIPNAPNLAGLEPFFQVIVLPASGSPYLSGLASARIF